MNIPAKKILPPKLQKRLIQQLHRIIRTLYNPRTQKKPLNIIPPIELHGQLTDLIRRKRCPRHIIGPPVQAILTVKNTLIGKQNLQKRNTPPVCRKAVTDPRLHTIPNPIPGISSGHPAGCTGYIILCRIRQNPQLLHNGHIRPSLYKRHCKSPHLYLAFSNMCSKHMFVSLYHISIGNASVSSSKKTGRGGEKLS